MTTFTDTHPALTVLGWDDEIPAGAHGIGSIETYREVDYGPVARRYHCYCDHWTKGYATQEEAFAALVRHAERANEAARRPGARMVIKDEPTITWLIVSTEDGLRVVGDHDWVVRTLDEVESVIGKLTPIPSA